MSRVNCMVKKWAIYVVLMLALMVVFIIHAFVTTKEIKKDKYLLTNSTFYRNYENTNGKTFTLYWENPGNLNSKLKQQIQTLFITSFLAQYRAGGTMKYLTDKEIKKDLESYFVKSVEPRFIINSKQHLLCASMNKKLLGFIFWEDLGQNKVYIAELVISHNHWRQGLGKVLLESIFRKKPNTKKIILLTELENYGARNFYEALGFKSSTYMREGYSRDKFYAYEKVYSK